jgi:hypothetical protein
MRIKIIGDNNCARATRHLLRLAGFAVTEFLPAEAVTQGPHAGYAITIELAPAPETPDASQRPDHPAPLHPASSQEETPPSPSGASSPSPAKDTAGASDAAFAKARIRFGSVDSAIETAVLRHVTQLAAAPVIVDRPGGVVQSDRELRIIAPNTGDARADEAAAVAIEFGVLRGVLDLTTPKAASKARGNATSHSALTGQARGAPAVAPENVALASGRKKWWPFGIVLLAGALSVFRVSTVAAPRIWAGPMHVNAALAAPDPQVQFATGQGIKLTDGTNFLVVDPCKAQAKLYASINQTASTQIVAGTASKKIYVCSIHVVVAGATNVALVEGTGSVCGTGTAGVSGFGGATAATGWNFAANGGISLGNGDSSLGAEGTSGDNLCVFNSAAGQVSGGISYVLQ